MPEVVLSCWVSLRGKRIATPVCALVRNDMLKTGACQRVQGGGARGHAEGGGVSGCRGARACGAMTSPHCHCEERSDVAIRTPCGSTWQKVVLWANAGKCIRICPKWCQLARHFCGDADCHTSSPQSPPCSPPAEGQRGSNTPLGSSPRKGCPFAGSHALVRNDRLGRRAHLRGRQQCTTFPSEGLVAKSGGFWYNH